MGKVKKSTVVYVKKPLINLPKFAIRNKRLFSALILIILLILTAFLVKQLRMKPRTPTVTVNGQEVPAAFLTPEFKVKNVPNPKIDYQKQIENLEVMVSKDPGSVEDFVNLGHLYLKVGDKTKAIENYRKAQSIADPKMPGYQSFIEAMEQAIMQLQESSSS